MSIADVEELIPIEDDEIDEAQEQVFIILLEVLEAVNFDLITITRNTSFGRIIDNDGEPTISFYLFYPIKWYCGVSFYLFFLLGIQIGFARSVYFFSEPPLETMINDIVLVREGGRLSEQTFQVTVSVGGTIDISPATLEFEDEERADYRLAAAPADFISLNFPPDQQNITLAVILFNDSLLEGTEAFRAISTSQIFSNFGPPSMVGAIASTEVLIIDDDCKLACILMCSIMP